MDASFCMAERPVKLLLISYFKMFSDIEIDATCARYHIAKTDVPKAYITIGNISADIAEINAQFLQHTSIFKVPPRNGEINLNYAAGKHLLYLDLIEFDQISATAINDMENRYAIFKEAVPEIKKHHGALLSMSLFVFNWLYKNNEYMDKLAVNMDPSTLTMKLIDTRFKNLAHHTRMQVCLKKDETADLQII